MMLKNELNEVRKYVFVPPMDDEYHYPYYAYCVLVSAVPAGKVTREEDVIECLEHVYGINGLQIADSVKYTEDIGNIIYPYWRIVSTRGNLTNSFLKSSEMQKERLETEGIALVKCRKDTENYKVASLMERLFDFATLHITIMECEQKSIERINSNGRSINAERV